MRRIRLLAAAACSALLGACATANIAITPSGRNLDLAPRKADCVVEFHRTRPPDRPFDEVATLHLEGERLDAWEAQERLRRRACELGADAVVVTRDYARIAGLPVVMTASAVSYPEVRGDAGARLARDARGILDLMPPPGFSVATAHIATALRASPEDTLAKGEIAAGTAIWAEKVYGGCRARHPDGREGWVDCAALSFGAPPAPEKPSAADAAPAPSSI